MPGACPERSLQARMGTSAERLDLQAYREGLAAARRVLGKAKFEALAAEGGAIPLDLMVTYALAGDDFPTPLAREAVSLASPSGVDVPCAFTYWMSSAFRPALRSEASIARRGPSMLGAVMWFASALIPMPASSA